MGAMKNLRFGLAVLLFVAVIAGMSVMARRRRRSMRWRFSRTPPR